MNIGNILDLLREDPSIADDVPAFLKRINEPNIEIIVEQPVVIKEKVTKIVSFAKRCGGECTEANVLTAIKMLEQEPLKAEAKKRSEMVLAAIEAGETLTSEDLVAKFAESLKE